MEIANLAAATAPQVLPSTLGVNGTSPGFADIFHATKAPPGPEPPPGKTNQGEKEQKTVEPNAQSKKPDLSSTKETTDKNSKSSDHKVKSTTLLPEGLTFSALASQIPQLKGLASKDAGKVAVPDSPATPTPATPTTDKVSLNQLPQDASAAIVSTKVAEPDLGQAFAQAQDQAASALDQTTAASAADLQDSLVTTDAAGSTGNLDSAGESALSKSAADTKTDLFAPQPAPQTAQQIPVVNPQNAGFGAQNSQAGNGGGNSPDKQPKQAQTDAISGFQVVKEISAHVDRLAAVRSAENVTVHLKGEDDSNITLNVRTLHGQVQAQIMTDSGALKNALHNNKSQLASTLESRGMNLGDVSVGLQNSGRQQSGNQGQASPRQIASYSGLNGGSTAPMRTIRKATGVDLSV